MTNLSPERRSHDPKGGPIPFSIALIFFGLALGFYAWSASVGWTHTIDDRYGWRQTQTALSAAYLVGKPFKLAYETPIYGPPWSVPLEFPLEQYLVARLSARFGLELESAGRWVSVVFHLLLLAPAWLILGSLRMEKGLRFVALGLFLFSPFYLFWSRTFMIESTALFFSTAYLACCLRSRDRPAAVWLAGAVVAGSLAGMIKVTTFAAFALLAAAGSIHQYFVAESREGFSRFAARMAAIGGIPLAALLWWTHFADGVKMANPGGRVLVSSALTAWNFGTMAQKLSAGTWKLILGRAQLLLAPSPPWLFWLGVFALLFLAFRTGRRRRAILGAFVGFFIPAAIFTNLHYVHEYYMYASGIFLLAAVILGIVSLIEQRAFRWIGYGAGVLVMVASISGYLRVFWPVQLEDSPASLRIGLQIRTQSPPDAVNIILSQFGDPTYAYYSQRRALLLIGDAPDAIVHESLENLRAHPIGGIFVEPGNHYPVEKLNALLREHALTATGVYPLRRE